jgi:hypothetical protein
MPWVVTSWRTDRLAELVDEQAREAAAAIVTSAEREARRIRRTAEREAADARAYLSELEGLASETLEHVRVVRRDRTVAPSEHVMAPPDARVAPVRTVEPPRPAPRPRRARATMRESPLTELFRSTAVR